MPALVSRLDNVMVQLEVIAALDAIAAPESVRPLIELLANSQRVPNRIAAATTLGASAGPSPSGPRAGCSTTPSHLCERPPRPLARTPCDQIWRLATDQMKPSYQKCKRATTIVIDHRFSRSRSTSSAPTP